MSLPLTDPMSEEQDFMRAQFRMNLFQKLVAHVAQYSIVHGIGRKALAQRAGKSPAQITRWLNSPANLQLDTISDLLLATGARLTFDVEALQRIGDNEAPSTYADANSSTSKAARPGTTRRPSPYMGTQEAA